MPREFSSYSKYRGQIAVVGATRLEPATPAPDECYSQRRGYRPGKPFQDQLTARASRRQLRPRVDVEAAKTQGCRHQSAVRHIQRSGVVVGKEAMIASTWDGSAPSFHQGEVRPSAAGLTPLDPPFIRLMCNGPLGHSYILEATFSHDRFSRRAGTCRSEPRRVVVNSIATAIVAPGADACRVVASPTGV
jgi:hypothetical protein